MQHEFFVLHTHTQTHTCFFNQLAFFPAFFCGNFGYQVEAWQFEAFFALVIITNSVFIGVTQLQFGGEIQTKGLDDLVDDLDLRSRFNWNLWKIQSMILGRFVAGWGWILLVIFLWGNGWVNFRDVMMPHN